jgi:hypothetical protein
MLSLAQLVELANTSYRTDSRESYVQFIEADTFFHLGIARLSRNQMLVRAVNEARSQMERIMYAAIDIHYYGEVPARGTPGNCEGNSAQSNWRANVCTITSVNQRQSLATSRSVPSRVNRH